MEEKVIAAVCGLPSPPELNSPEFPRRRSGSRKMQQSLSPPCTVQSGFRVYVEVEVPGTPENPTQSLNCIMRYAKR
jgi:hypothetical protein